MSTKNLQIVMPFHQPLTASETELEAICAQVYAPLLDAIAQSGVKVAVHFTGHLLDFLSRHPDDLLARIKVMAKLGQIEILGGLFYGGVPALLPELDVRGQLEMMTEYWESMVGNAPQGFFLPELAWSAELPRLFEDTGFGYGFISSQQITLPETANPSLVTLLRGGKQLGAFVLDAPLSEALLHDDAATWMSRLAARGPLTSVWIRAESLGLWPGTRERAYEQGFLNQWLSALAAGTHDVTTVLPNAALALAKPATPAALKPGLAPELGAHQGLDWQEFIVFSPLLDTVYRRMLRVSDKLREAIDTMEQDGLEETWSDALATAQRLVFAAQAPDLYWQGPHPGFDNPVLRDAVVDRLSEAEGMIDGLVQGESDWIAVEEDDRDGDLVDEVFVANRHLSAWLLPQAGAKLKSWDDRDSGKNLLDLTGEGTSEALLPLHGTLDDLTDAPAPLTTAVIRSEVDEDGDGTYWLHVRMGLSSVAAPNLVGDIEKRVSIPIDRAETTLRYTTTTPVGALLAITLPLRLPPDTRITVNDGPVDLVAASYPDVQKLTLASDAGPHLHIGFSPALTVWLAPVPQAPGSLVVVPVVRLNDQAEATLTLCVTGSEV